MRSRFCHRCGERLVRKTRPYSGIPRDVCPECDSDSPYLATDGGYEPISDLTDLWEGDRVLWGERDDPLVVVRTTFGSHIFAEGTNGSLYQVLPDHREHRPAFRLARGGPVRRLRRVERERKGAEGAQ